MGKTRTAAVRVVVHQPPELIAFAGDAGFADYYCAFELSPTATGGTAVVSRSEFRLHGLWRLGGPVFGGELRRETARELGELKRIAEQARDTRLHPRPVS
jgi:hypothetical protein